MAELHPPRPSDRILVIASDAASVRSVRRAVWPKSRPLHSMPNRFRRGDRSRNFAAWRPNRGPLKGGKCFRNCHRIVYRAGDQHRAGARHRGDRSSGSNPHTIQFIRPPPPPPSSDPRLVVSADDCTSFSAKRPRPLWKSAAPSGRHHCKTSVAKFREYLPPCSQIIPTRGLRL
jgi:hypothetical protein